MYQTTITSNAPPEVSHATPTTASPSPANPGVPDPTAAAVPAKIQGAQWTVSSTGVLQNSMDGGKTWYPAMSSQPRIMRAVYAFANQVWAGGNSGLLLHSTDAGQHWETVTISSGDEKLTADIVRITFASPDRGVVVGTDGITWLTSDGGRTWKPWR
jgi:photosystem II stability/assembly factor-like uncharacterized protein